MEIIKIKPEEINDQIIKNLLAAGIIEKGEEEATKEKIAGMCYIERLIVLVESHQIKEEINSHRN